MTQAKKKEEETYSFTCKVVIHFQFHTKRIYSGHTLQSKTLTNIEEKETRINLSSDVSPTLLPTCWLFDKCNVKENEGPYHNFYMLK
jgi:hypothetical protein